MKHPFGPSELLSRSSRVDDDEAQFIYVISALQRAIRNNYWVAGVVFVGAVATAIVTVSLLPHLTEDSAKTIEHNPDNILLAVFILL